MFLEESIARNEVRMPHTLTLDGRERLTVSGVEDVENFDENAITLYTSEGTLTVSGEDLHIEKLNLDSGELCLTGRVSGLEYEDGVRERGGLFARLFG